MTESLSMVERAIEFVRKFNNDEYDFAKADNDDQQKTLDSLANAVNAFEVAERDLKLIGTILENSSEIGRYSRITRQNNYDMALSNLNRFIKLAKINKLYSDRDQKGNSELQRTKELLGKAEKDKLTAERKLEYIFKFHPQLKELVDGVQDSKVKDD